jgi:O-antigen/teichoic acid export membrane protein
LSADDVPPTVNVPPLPLVNVPPLPLVNVPTVPAVERLSPSEVRTKAVRGVIAVASREIVLRGFGLAASLVLTRLLTPTDFGVIAFGSTLIAFGTLVANGGFGAQLVQGDTEPTREELRALQGISFGGSFVLFALIAAVALPIGGRAGDVAALMATSLPLSALSAPNAIVAERRLLSRPGVRADIAQAVIYNLLSVGLVIAGLGVWGVAVGLLVGTVVGTVVLILAGPIGFVVPQLSWSASRRFLRFGFTFQAAGLASLLRDQGLNLLAASLGGLRVLGIWSLATKVLQGVTFVFAALLRVSFPAVARLIESGGDAREAVQRALSISTVVTGFAVVAIGGSAPALVPIAFGSRWSDVISVLPWAAAGLMVSGPIATTAASFLYAIGEARAVLTSIIAHSLAWYVVAVPLLPVMGAEALGIGWAVGAAADAIVLSRALARHRIGMAEATAPPTFAAALAGAVGWGIAVSLPPGWLALGASLLAGQLAYLFVMLMARPQAVLGVVDVVRRARAV